MSDKPEHIRNMILQTLREANAQNPFYEKVSKTEHYLVQVCYTFYCKGFKEAIRGSKMSLDKLEEYFIKGVSP